MAASASGEERRENPMLYWSLIFLAAAVVLFILGFGGLATTAATVAKVLFIVCIAFAVVSFIASLVTRRHGHA
jgi:uncharacterized membrane protein YtjA (UPF0391 family)